MLSAKNITVRVAQNRLMAQNVFMLSFASAYLAKKAKPGQFVEIKVDGKKVLLRRPFSIHRVEKKNVFLLIKITGKATRILSQVKRGAKLDIIGPLGNGFSLEPAKAVLIAGGIGVAPLYFLAQHLRQKNRPVKVFLGAASKKEILCANDFRQLGCSIYFATDDGSRGKKADIVSFAVQELKKEKAGFAIYACGPQAMFLSLRDKLGRKLLKKAQLSWESFMGCGLGVCRSCAIKTKKGYQLVCQDGPVFRADEVWDWQKNHNKYNKSTKKEKG